MKLIKNTLFKTLLKTSFLLLLISAIYGFLMRWNFTFPITNFQYKNILQGHSHVAFLGWGYLSVIVLIIHFFITKKQSRNGIYKYTLFIILLCIVLMLFSFPFLGYKVFSIVLLSAFGITSYILSFKALKDINGSAYSVKFVQFGVYYYLLSSLATWFLAVVLVTQGKTNLYYNTVYFYLHFLYNGFVVFALFGLFLKLLEKLKISISKNDQKNFFILLNLGCIPTYFLSVLWSDVSIVYNFIGGFGAFFQLLSGFYLLKILTKFKKSTKCSFVIKAMFWFFITSYFLKISIQFVSAFPYFVNKSIALKPFLIIGYLHLFTLGFMTVFIIFLLNEFKVICLKSSFSKFGILLLLIGIFATELLMFGQGLMLLLGKTNISNYHFNLLVASAILLIGILTITIIQLFKKQTI